MDELKSSYVKVADGLHNTPLGDLEFVKNDSVRSGNFTSDQSQQRQDERVPAMCGSLNYKQRMLGFGVTIVLGLLFVILSWVSAFKHDHGAYAAIYSFANVFNMGSTLFLCAPLMQLSKMRKPYRLIATIVFLVMMVLCYVVAIAARVPGLVVFFGIVQYLALAWYCITYLPAVKHCILHCLPCLHY